MRTKEKQSNVCNYLADSQIAVTSFGNELCHCSIEVNVKIHFSVGILWLDVPCSSQEQYSGYAYCHF